MTKRETAVWVMQKIYSNFYKWGGDDPSGWDCSGAILEALKSCGMFPRDGDITAQGMYHFYARIGRSELRVGDLVFWQSADGNSIEHVAMIWNLCPLLSIGASGGGSSTETEQDAIDQNAYVKIRPVDNRSGEKYYGNPYRDELEADIVGV